MCVFAQPSYVFEKLKESFEDDVAERRKKTNKLAVSAGKADVHQDILGQKSSVNISL